MPENIDIQIIVPAYNVENYLDAFFIGVLQQNIQNFILIVVDDASTDNTFSILSKYKNIFDERMILIRNQTNLGPSQARNKGLDEAVKHPAKYITFLDPDDMIDSDYLRDLYDNAEKYQAGITISGLQRFEDGTGHIICTEMVNYPDKFIGDVSKCDDFAYINPCTYAKLYLFDAIRNIRFREMKRSEDTCYLFEILPLLKTAKFTNHAYYHYRIRNTSLSGSITEEKYTSMHERFTAMMGKFDTKEYRPFKDMFETQVFIRSSVGGVCRYAFGDMRKTKDLCERELIFLNSNIPGWRTNKYLSFHRHMNKGIKPFALRICALMYKWHVFPLFVYFYYFMSQVLKKDVRA